MPRDNELHKVAKDGDTESVKSLVAEGSAVDEPGAQGRTALHRALGGGFVECAAVLLELGADASIKDQMQRTSLHWAVGAPDPGASSQCVELLFDRCSAAAEEMINCQSKSGCAIRVRGHGRILPACCAFACVPPAPRAARAFRAVSHTRRVLTLRVRRCAPSCDGAAAPQDNALACGGLRRQGRLGALPIRPGSGSHAD